MTTAGPVLGEGRGSDAFFDALDHVIDVHGHIIGMGLSPDNRWAPHSVLGGGVCKPPVLTSMPSPGTCTSTAVPGPAAQWWPTPCSRRPSQRR